jgi:hypothetical protein
MFYSPGDRQKIWAAGRAYNPAHSILSSGYAVALRIPENWLRDKRGKRSFGTEELALYKPPKISYNLTHAKPSQFFSH